MKISMKKPRGSIFLLTIVLVLPLMLVLAGIAVDVSILYTVRTELHRAMDAAALAGAGKLGFNDSVFPTVRQNAQTYAVSNPYQYGGISLSLNAANANNPMFPDVLPASWPPVLTPPGGVTQASGDIVLGVWDPDTSPKFQPSLDGTRVNAVQCRAQTNVPTYFLRLVGLPSLPTSARSIAIANPPNTAEPETCLFPVGVTSCTFYNNGVFTSQGCGTPVTFISSSGQAPGPAPGTNTGAWVQFNNPLSNPTPAEITSEITAAASGGTCNYNIAVGDYLNANGGMIQNAFDILYNKNRPPQDTIFYNKYQSSPWYDITNWQGEVLFQTHGWQVTVPVLPCVNHNINETLQVLTFARFIITQVMDRGECSVDNPNDAASRPYCPYNVTTNPGGAGCPTASRDWPNAGGCPTANYTSNLRALFGYFVCEDLRVPPTPRPAPRTALGTRLRLVQ